jgi:Cu+-exporting ATPase
MDINIREAKGASDYNGMTYYFCSGGCKVDFDADPEGVLKAEGEYDHSQPSEMMMESEAPGPVAASSSSSGEKKPWWKFWG